jgi:Flp pilus assembly protein TadD
MTKRRSSSSPAPAPIGTRPHPLRLALLLLVLAGSLAYGNSLAGPLIFDDTRTIVDNTSIRQMSTALQPDAQTPVAGRPIANLTFAVNYALGERSVTGYHVVNVAIHILAALTLFGLLRRLFAQPESDTDRSPSGQAPGDGMALVCAMAWLLHPLNTESVDYLTQRTESLVGLFFLLTLYAAVRAWTARPAWPWALMAIAANACGTGTKESMILAPVFVVLCDRAFRFPTFREAFAERYRLYAGLAAGWLIFLALARGTPYFAPAGFATRVSRWTYFLNQPDLIMRYLRLSVWPRGLVLDYGLPQPLTVFDVWPSALVLIGLAALTIVAIVRAPRLGFWGVWFFVTLAPASSFIPIPTEVGAERRMYLPLVAVVVILVSTAWRVALVRRYATVLACLALVALGIGTVARNSEYRDGVAIWQTVLARWPHARAHANLAVELREAGQVDESIRHLRVAAPVDAESKHALGSALIERGPVAEGISQLEEFVRLYPGDLHVSDARQELAAALYREGRLAEAIGQLRAVATSLPDYALGHANLANLLLESRDYGGAVDQYREVLRLKPGNLVAQRQLAVTLSAGGRLDEAAAAFRKALELDPRDVTAIRGLVDVLLRGGQFGEAEQEARRIVSAYPNDAASHNVLGIALASQGRTVDAAREFETAARLDPQMKEAQDNLARVRSGASRR